MNSTKDEIQSLLAKLPDDCTFEDAQHHLYVLGKIRRGIERAESEGTLSQEEAERRLGKSTSQQNSKCIREQRLSSFRS